MAGARGRMPPDGPPDPIRVTLEFTALLDRVGVPYLVAGSLASSVHGEPRSTDDIDLVADLRPFQVPALFQALGWEYYAREEAIRDAVARGAGFNLIHLATAVKVDVYVMGNDPFDAGRCAMPGSPDSSIRLHRPAPPLPAPAPWRSRDGPWPRR